MGTSIKHTLLHDEMILPTRDEQLNHSYDCQDNYENVIYRIRRISNKDNYKCFVKRFTSFHEVMNDSLKFIYCGYLDEAFISDIKDIIRVKTRDTRTHYTNYNLNILKSEDKISQDLLYQFLYSDINKSKYKPKQSDLVFQKDTKFTDIQKEFVKNIAKVNYNNTLYKIVNNSLDPELYNLILFEFKFDDGKQLLESEDKGILNFLYITDNFVNFIIENNDKTLTNYYIDIYHSLNDEQREFVLKLNEFYKQKYGTV